MATSTAGSPTVARPGLRAGLSERRVAQRTAAFSWRRGERCGRVASGAGPGRGWRLAAAAAGVVHAGVVAPSGAWPVVLVTGVTVAVAGVWPWLLAGHRQELAGALGVVWLAVAVATAGWPLAALSASVAGVAMLAGACRSLW